MSSSKVLVDADACPVKNIITDVAKRYNLEVLFFIDTSHELRDDYAKVIVIQKGRDAVDLALINQTNSGDIVVTQDYGLASLALARGAKAIHHSGMIYNSNNIDRLLFERHLNSKARRAGRQIKGPPRRKAEDDLSFRASFEKLCSQLGRLVPHTDKDNRSG